MNRTDYTSPAAEVVEIISESVLCFSTTAPGSNEDYVEKEFEW